MVTNRNVTLLLKCLLCKQEVDKSVSTGTSKLFSYFTIKLTKIGHRFIEI